MTESNKILVITYWSYDDPLIQGYTLPYLKIIKQLNPEKNEIHLVTLEKKNNFKNIRDKAVNEILTNNIQLPYTPFGSKAFFSWFKSIFKLIRYVRKNKINVLHTWCTPAGMIGYIIHIFTKTRFIADSFEPHAESMVENGTWTKNSRAYKILFGFERKIVKKAEHIIGIAPGIENYIFEKYKHKLDTVFIKPACVNLEKFNLELKKNNLLLDKYSLNDKIICLYAGKFGGIYFDEEVFSFFKKADEYFGDKITFLILSNESREVIQNKIINSGTKADKFLIKSVPHAEMPDWIGLADFALCPVKPVPSKKYCSPVKTGEYWAMGLPVIITKNISNDSSIVEQSGLGYVWKNMDEKEFLKSLIKIEELLTSDKKNLTKEIRQLAITYRNFQTAKEIYKKIYKSVDQY